MMCPNLSNTFTTVGNVWLHAPELLRTIGRASTLFFHPNLVGRFGPRQVYLARNHRLVCPAHAQGTDVDVIENDRDHDHAERPVHVLGELHAVNVEQ
jgi:hypothetical protein